MAQQTRTTLKGYFETGDTPTQAQFEDLIDSNFNLTDNDSDDITEGATNLFLTSAERSKLSGVEAGADVTDTANVTAAGALMDSEITNLAQVKAFDSSDYATAAQGATADSALQDVVDDTTPQLGGDLDANSKRILNVSQIDSNSIVKNSQTLLITTGAATFKSSKGNFATITLTENTTIGFQITGGEELILEVTQDTTTRTVTFTNVLWAGGIAPTITVASGAKDVFRFTCINDVIYGEIIGQNMS